MSDGDRPTILVVDDRPENLDVLVGILSRSYRVIAATTGQRALEIARRQPAPDIVLLDVMIPELDGYGVLARLQEDPATRPIPVIFVTALSDHADEFRGLSLGAVDYITKPVSAPVVEARIRTQLTLRRQRQELEQKVAELQAAQGRLVQAEKHASLSVLVAGVAHEPEHPAGHRRRRCHPSAGAAGGTGTVVLGQRADPLAFPGDRHRCGQGRRRAGVQRQPGRRPGGGFQAGVGRSCQRFAPPLPLARLSRQPAARPRSPSWSGAVFRCSWNATTAWRAIPIPARWRIWSPTW
ncbi:MAG: response regulator [Magnetospirillum sp.]|nr:response regulator [Magnetospirillum sp.]